MKKFEEEINKKVGTFDVVGHHNGVCCLFEEVKALGKDWVSPEDHQAEIAKLNSKIDWLHGLLDERNEEVLQTVKRLNEAQSEIPEVPQFVADWLDKKPLYTINSFIPVEIIGWSKKQTGYADLGMNINHLLKLKVNGYTVAKEKRFYLKHKSVLIFDPDSDDSDVEELYLGAGGNFVPYKHLAKIFTQSEIDSMAAESYEQIEVEE